MRLRTLAVLLATVIVAVVSASAQEVRLPTVKLDKNLRRALLKALADLDTESAEQKSLTEAREAPSDDLDTSTSSESTINADDEQSSPEPIRTIFSFDGFPSEDETPSEDKLQNSTFVESEKYLATGSSNSATTVETTRDENNRVFQSHEVVVPDKSSAIYDQSSKIVDEQVETRSVKSSSSSKANGIEVSAKPSANLAGESLAISSSNGIATANALVSPSPTVSSPTAKQNANVTKSSGNKRDEQEVKIFQAPLVAAFTVQQDERGVPKSVLPIYGPNGDGQALTLQEQLDFKQKLLERQLAELQAQQTQQTQFLVRQQQIYEQQLRQKQQQQLFLQEQNRFKQIQEEQSRLKQFQDQRNYRLQQQKQAQQFPLTQNGLLSLQPPFKSPNVNVQPSLVLELPKTSQAPAFQANFHEQLRIKQLQRQQQQQALLQQQQQLQQARQQQLLQQQRLQQSFSSFPIDFQPPNSSPAQRFNRQEAFGAVGNFGFNDNRQQTSNNRNHFGFNQQASRGPQTFTYNPYQTQQLQYQHQQQQQQNQQYRTQRPQTPAKQIQHLLYQSGVAGDLGAVQGTGGQEDLNIVSKVLALNVGAIPTKNLRYPGNNFGNPNSA